MSCYFKKKLLEIRAWCNFSGIPLTDGKKLQATFLVQLNLSTWSNRLHCMQLEKVAYCGQVFWDFGFVLQKHKPKLFPSPKKVVCKGILTFCEENIGTQVNSRHF